MDDKTELEEAVDILSETSEVEVDDGIGDSMMDTISSTMGDDMPDGISFGIKLSGAPRKDWTKILGQKFNTGDLVVSSTFDDDTWEDDVWAMKIIGPAEEPGMYYVKRSGCRDDIIQDGFKLKLAPDDAKWKSYYEENNCFNIPGLKVSCPSNDMMKKKLKSGAQSSC